MGPLSPKRGLFPFFVEGLLVAARAELEDFHLVRMGLFVPGGDVVFFTALGAFKDDLIAFGGHIFTLPSFSAGLVYHSGKQE